MRQSFGLPEHFDHWWQALLAIPFDRKDGMAYRRLQRVFRDQTLRLSRRKDDPPSSRHQFTSPGHETHYTVSLWENFSLFSPDQWLPELWRRSGLASALDRPEECNWSYEWGARVDGKTRILDITLRYRDALGEGILVVEAKKPGVALSADKDLNPGWYRQIPEFQGFDRFSFLYLVSAEAWASAEAVIRRDPCDVGFLSWEELAACQISCARDAGWSPAMTGFVAASLHRQALQLGIDPGMPPLPYLADEPSALEVVNRTTRVLSGSDWDEPLWLERHKAAAGGMPEGAAPMPRSLP